jgi:hypothetical protein
MNWRGLFLLLISPLWTQILHINVRLTLQDDDVCLRVHAPNLVSKPTLAFQLAIKKGQSGMFFRLQIDGLFAGSGGANFTARLCQKVSHDLENALVIIHYQNSFVPNDDFLYLLALNVASNFFDVIPVIAPPIPPITVNPSDQPEPFQFEKH